MDTSTSTSTIRSITLVYGAALEAAQVEKGREEPLAWWSTVRTIRNLQVLLRCTLCTRHSPWVLWQRPTSMRELEGAMKAPVTF
jgi:hypothetical protein